MHKSWIKIERVKKEDYNKKNSYYEITRYWLPKVILEDTEFNLYGVVNHTNGQNGVLLLASDTDYTSPGDGTYTKSGLIAGVIGAISQEFYDKLIEELIKGGGQGDNDAWIGFDKEKNKACFEFNFCLPEGDPHAEITYTDSVKLFHAYFNAYKKFVEECAPEIKEKLYFYTKKKWYPRFLEALKKLNEYYEKMVEKGEIEE